MVPVPGTKLLNKKQIQAQNCGRTGRAALASEDLSTRKRGSCVILW